MPETPAWIPSLVSAYTGPAVAPAPAPSGDAGQQMALALAAPLVAQARQQLLEGARQLVRQHEAAPFSPEAAERLLFPRLANALSWLAGRVLVLELNVARVQGQLPGETPEQRFQAFVERLRQPEAARALLEEYPVLARVLLTYTQRWVETSLAFLRHLAEDWSDLKRLFWSDSRPPAGELVELSAAGDPHRGGRQVVIVRFSSGLRLVYKPRSLSIDTHFRALLMALNERAPVTLEGAPAGTALFQVPELLDRGDHGWVEFISQQGCASPEEVHRFYERQGAYLALLYALGATDFHLQNLIAAGEHPVMIDLESFFHPPWGFDNSGASQSLAEMTLGYSVLRVGLLPQRIWVTGSSEGVEVSGLGGKPGQLAPNPVPSWEGVGTDAQHLTRKRMEMPGAQNRPTLQGTEVELLDHADGLISSFKAMYRHLAAHRDELLAASGPLSRFDDDEVRVVLRPTYIYSLLLRESFHPDLLRDGLERERFLDRLWVGIAQQPELAQVIPFEQEAARWGDIPLFTNRPGTLALQTDTGQPLPGFFKETGKGWVEQRLRQFGEEDLERQLWFIRASFTAITKEVVTPEWAGYQRKAPSQPASPERLLAAARKAGDRLAELALRGKEDASWVGLKLVGPHYWSLSAAGTELYDGVAGIAFFLAYLGEVTREPSYTRLAREAVVTLRRQLARMSTATPIGAFSGWGGVIYTLTHLGVLWKEPELLELAETLVERIPPLLSKDDAFDIIGGAAGCIAGLASLYRFRRSARTLEVAEQCGDWLLSKAQPLATGVGWTPAHSRQPLAGFSHGASGFSSALLELSALSGQARFRDTALRALEYERTLFQPEAKNWPNLSSVEPGKPAPRGPHMCGWCHGAAGVGLGRLRSLPYLDDARVREELAITVSTTLEQGFGHNHSLCHGDLGNVELLLHASQVLGDSSLRAQTYELAAMILDSISERGFLCGVPLSVEIPGLMTGIAGIGYQLLRLAAPERIPSVLVLEPPRSA